MLTEYGRSAYGDSTIPEDEYFERTAQVDAIADMFARASRGEICGGRIEGPRGIGKTDLTRRAIEQHLEAEPNVAVIWYPIQPYQLDLFDFARSYFNTFIRQYRYSRDRESADLQECVDAWSCAAPQCQSCREPVLREICEAMGRAFVQRDATNTLSLLINMPHYLAELQGQRSIVIFDQARYLRKVRHNRQELPLLRHLLTNLESSDAPLFFVDTPGALRVILGEKADSDQLAVHKIPRFDTVEAMTMFQTLCERLGIDLSVRLVETMIAQLGGNPFYIHSLVRRAHLIETSLDSTDRLGQVYAQEVRDGTIHWFWRAEYSTVFPYTVDRQRAVDVCSHLAGFHPQRANLARLEQQISLDPVILQKVLFRLQQMGVLDRSFGTVGLVDDPILRDVTTVLEWGESSDTSDSELLRRLAARRVRGATTPSPDEMLAEFQGRLQRLLESFHGQYLPSEWFHYRDDHGAAWTGPRGLRKWLGTSDTMLRLPYLSSVSRLEGAAVAVGRSLSRPVVLYGSGFRDKQMTKANETVWATVLWPTADPLGAEHVYETIRLRKEVGRRVGCKVRHTWLLGRGAFTREARKLCSKLRILSGNMDMIDYIYDQMFAEGSPWREKTQPAAAPPEMIPVRTGAAPAEPEAVELSLVAGNYPERVATEQLEEIARAAGFSLTRIGQMKMAVLEAVVNAAETSADPSDKITVRYVVSSDRLEVSVRNCAPRAAGPAPAQFDPNAETLDQSATVERRLPKPPKKQLTGWGLRMIYTLADEVTIRPLEGGTEIRMICRRELA